MATYMYIRETQYVLSRKEQLEYSKEKNTPVKTARTSGS